MIAASHLPHRMTGTVAFGCVSIADGGRPGERLATPTGLWEEKGDEAKMVDQEQSEAIRSTTRQASKTKQQMVWQRNYPEWMEEVTGVPLERAAWQQLARGMDLSMIQPTQPRTILLSQ